jgi:hypothetical protein
MWVINIQNWLDETMSGPAVPQLNLKVKKAERNHNLCDICCNRDTNRIDPLMSASAQKKTLQR